MGAHGARDRHDPVRPLPRQHSPRDVVHTDKLQYPRPCVSAEEPELRPARWSPQRSFSIQLSNNASEQFTGSLGTLPAGAAHWYGCTPFDGALLPDGYTTGDSADLFLVDGSNLIVFYRPAAYAGATIGVGSKVSCY